MDYFDDDWGEEPLPQPSKADVPLQATTVETYPQASFREETSNRAVEQPSSQSFDIPQETTTSSSQRAGGFGLSFDDEWHDSDANFDKKYVNQQTQAAPQQPIAPTQQFIQEPVKQPEPKKVEVEKPKKVVQPEESKPADPPAKAAPPSAAPPSAAPPSAAPPSAAPVAQAQQPSRNVLSGASKVQKWGDQKPQQFAKKSVTRPPRNKGRKGPIVSQKAGGNSSKKKVQHHSPEISQSEAASKGDGGAKGQSDIQKLMDRVAILEERLSGMETANHAVCTLNSTGLTDHNGVLIWDSRHIIDTRENSMMKLTADKKMLQCMQAGLYHITLTTCGANPQLFVHNGEQNDVFASAISSPVLQIQGLRSRTGASSTSINIYLHLSTNYKISGHITQLGRSFVNNPCEHWLCVRLVRKGL